MNYKEDNQRENENMWRILFIDLYGKKLEFLLET